MKNFGFEKLNRSARLLPVFFFLCAIAFSSCNDKRYSTEKVLFNQNWEFIYDGNSFPASVPGCIHLDLMQNNIIEDPFFRDNEQKVQWVSDRKWIYKKSFDKSDIPSADNVLLVFEGLDTYANIYINGELIKKDNAEFSAFNMFREWRFNLPDNLKDSDNELMIEFLPSSEIDKQKAALLDYTLPDERVFTRKAPYQSGWDWGPRLITCGIWKSVYFETWNDLKINTFQVYTETLNKDNAIIKIIAELQSDISEEIDITLLINNKIAKSGKKEISKGNNIIGFYVQIDSPELWYPYGMGKQNLYDVKIKLESKNSYDVAEQKVGLRTIKLITDKDTIGSKFEFHVNGIPVFMKGANYIPSESFTVSRTREQHYKLIEDCKNANFNMLRVWGGGIYEDAEFYDACDELGILIWQDFMFACALYPGDKNFLENVEIEAKEQVLRLRNHACMALWCGNNEVKNGWEDWGWQSNYTAAQRDEIYAAYEAVFHQILPETIEKYDSEMPYHASSPLWGWGHRECCTEGDSHYWGVWWGEEPFEVWKDKTGRFMSEYGFQSYPEFSSVKRFTAEEDWNINSAVMKNHQKHDRGIEIIDNYMERYFSVPENFEDYLYVSQLLQAYGIGDALETHRIRMPHCMGTLYWQLNDCWPVASWSSIDYYGNKKALYYTAKNKFEEIILASEMQKDTLAIYLVSDLQNDISGQLNIEITDFYGNILKKDVINDVIANKNTSSKICDYPISKDFMAKADEIFVLLSFSDTKNSIQATKVQYIAYPKYLKLPKPEIKFSVQKDKKTHIINLSSNVLAKDVFVSSSTNGEFSDNYFDLLPNCEKIIIFTTEKNEEPDIKIKSYLNAF